MIKKIKNIFLGIDYGVKNIGLAISADYLAEPLKTIKYFNNEKVLQKLKKIIINHKVSKVIIGISENKMAQATREFVKQFKKITDIPIIFWDETLTSIETREKLIQARKSIKERNAREHELAACLILQDYLDRRENNC